MEDEIKIIFLLLLFVIAMTAVIGAFVVRTKTGKSETGDTSVGMRELEERIQKAVETANEPLRQEINRLRGELESLQPRQKKLEGGAIHETPLLADRGREA